jgi:outer membrane receptor protein involved in Fe transport
MVLAFVAVALTIAGVSGRVVDATGAPVAGAVVQVQPDGAPIITTETAADGRFDVPDVTSGPVTVHASAPGFAEVVVHTTADAAPLEIVLQPARVVDTVTVTAARGAERLQAASGATVLASPALLNSAAGTLDDALRNTPGFSLFRRSSSRVANPTTQGVTLRGVSGSGASRTLVLADGFPLNDPFGSWVYWNRIPLAAIDRVEVVRGAAGDLYGADALGGVIQVLTFAPGRPRLRATVDGGSHDTARVSIFGGGQVSRWTATAAGELVESGGVLITARESRGPIDVAADSDYRAAFVTLGYAAGAWRAQARGSILSEARGNGTPAQVNATAWRQISGEASGPIAGGVSQFRAGGGTQRYTQTFSAIADGRRSERLTTAQRVPSTFATAGGQWVRPWRGHALLAGAEMKRIESTVEETRVSFTGVPSGPFLSGGIETDGSIFARASLAPTSGVTVGLGVRGDVWRSTPRDAAAPGHSVNFLSPRASIGWAVRSGLALHAAAYRAHRTPTLNELYRPFRVGNVLTDANPQLEPERLTGLEGGTLMTTRRLTLRTTAFWTRLDEAISNITVSVTPALITRQRRNADALRAAGVELEAEIRPHRTLTLSAVAALTSSRFIELTELPALEGNRVPQVPAWQLGLTATYANPRIATVAAELRALGSQFDDDRNELELDEFGVLDVYAGRAIRRELQAFVAVENVFDAEYDVGRTPIRTVGWPRTVRAGVRLFLP